MPLEVILRRIMRWVVTLYTPHTNHSKNALYGGLRRCCRLSTMCGYAFFVEALYFGVTTLQCNGRVTLCNKFVMQERCNATHMQQIAT